MNYQSHANDHVHQLPVLLVVQQFRQLRKMHLECISAQLGTRARLFKDHSAEPTELPNV